jgi:hypothetical protein
MSPDRELIDGQHLHGLGKSGVPLLVETGVTGVAVRFRSALRMGPTGSHREVLVYGSITRHDSRWRSSLRRECAKDIRRTSSPPQKVSCFLRDALTWTLNAPGPKN